MDEKFILLNSKITKIPKEKSKLNKNQVWKFTRLLFSDKDRKFFIEHFAAPALDESSNKIKKNARLLDCSMPKRLAITKRKET